MTSEQRREARYRRRQERRRKQKEKRAMYDDFETVFSYDHLYMAYKKCRQNVAWKASVQKYISQAPLNVNQTYERLHDGSFKSSGFYEFDIRERGKVRHIKSVTINERIVQRCLCDYALVPMLKPTFIYDNGASLEKRGYHFAIRRMQRHLQEHYRKHGTNGYILLFDFSKFFDRISHNLCKRIICEQFTDERLIALISHFVDCFGDVGLGLGSQISQTFALASASRLDHYIKEVCRIRGYGRYMDDGYLIHESKEYLQQCLEDIRQICEELEITLNEKKTQIVKISHGFTFLKCRFFLTDTGRVIRKIYKKSVVRERRKLKKFAHFVQSGAMDPEDARTSFQSWKAYADNFHARNTINNMGRLYDRLFIDSWIAGEM